MPFRRLIAIRPRLLLALLPLLPLLPVALQAAPGDSTAVAVVDSLPTLEIRDPFFEFIIALVDGDSLGVWDQAAIRAWIEQSGRKSKLPVELLVNVQRRALGPGEFEISMGRSARRRLRIELTEDLKMPLPYSILGYHPGTMYVSRILEVVEWNLRSPRLTLPAKDETPEFSFEARDIIAMRLDEGYVVLDVDYLVDKLLGSYLDDTWNEAFVVARVDQAPEAEDIGLQGLALGRTRSGRAVSGAFDFANDKVLPNGRPVARALSAYARAWVAPWQQAADSRAWSWSP